jgi:AAA domain
MTLDSDHLTANTATDPNPPDTPLRLLEGVWAADLEAAREKMAWLWHGYLAPGSVTVLTSRWKAGKTTLLSVLLARRVTGGVVADRPLTAGRTAIVSEESRQQWHLRRGRLDFGNHTWFLCRPFPARPSPPQWLALIDRLAELRRHDGVDLVVIDSLAHFLPSRTENHAALMLEALAPLQRLTERGMAVLLLHHPKKGGAAEGEAARGSGALSAFADILIEMDCRTARAGDDRRRVLRGFSRYDETPHELVIELNAEGTDYAARGDARQDEFQASWSRLEAALMGAPGKLTRREIAARWPQDGEPPARTSLRRWLGEAVQLGLVRCEGAGSRESPLRYWLPQSEEAWKADPLYAMYEQERRTREEIARLDRRGPTP